MNIPLMNLKRLHDKIRGEIDNAIKDVIDSGKFINGPQVTQFEEAFANASDLKYCVGCANGTDALMIALKALGIKPGDEVIVPAMTFIATSEAVTAVGGKVVFADICDDTYCIDIESVKKAINAKTRAVIAVHLHGNIAPVEKLSVLCKEKNITLIEDCAQAHLAKINNKPVGSFGEVVTFSFFPGKNLGALGDAGAVCTNNGNLAETIRKLVNHGRIDKYKHSMEGYNMRLDTIQAAILLAKLPYLKEWIEHRRQKALFYNRMLKDLPVVLPYQSEAMYNVFHLYVTRLKNRDAVAKAFQNEGIETGIHYPVPLHLQPAYEYLGYKKGDFPVSEKCSEEFLSLPLCPEITEEEQMRVVSVLKKEIK